MSKQSEEFVFSKPSFTDRYFDDQDFAGAGQVMDEVEGIEFRDPEGTPIHDRYFRYNKGGGWWVGPSKYEGTKDSPVSDPGVCSTLDTLSQKIGTPRDGVLMIRRRALNPDQTITAGELHFDGLRVRHDWYKPRGQHYRLVSNMRPTEFWIPDETQRERICDGAARIVSTGLFRASGAVYENLMRYAEENEELFNKINALPGQVTIHDNNTLHREVSGASGMRYVLVVLPRG